jgi:hypothetical protein
MWFLSPSSPSTSFLLLLALALSSYLVILLWYRFEIINRGCYYLQLLYREWPNVLALLGGLIAIKTAIITAIGPRAGLTLAESVRIGLLLSQGGEFAFVVFSLANRYVFTIRNHFNLNNIAKIWRQFRCPERGCGSVLQMPNSRGCSNSHFLLCVLQARRASNRAESPVDHSCRIIDGSHSSFK